MFFLVRHDIDIRAVIETFLDDTVEPHYTVTMRSG